MIFNDQIPGYFSDVNLNPFEMDFSNYGKRPTMNLRNEDGTITTFTVIAR